jgi:hypothetical protein
MIDIVFHPDKAGSNKHKSSGRTRKKPPDMLFNAPWARNEGTFRVLPAAGPDEKTPEPVLRTLTDAVGRY